MKKLFSLLFFLFIASAVFAQQERPIVQFSGVIHNSDSTAVIVPYVSIVNTTNKNQVNISNYKGYFSFPAHEQDTVRFSCVGYASTTVIIPANVANKSYTIEVDLKPEIINLPVFKVFPWATTEEFRKDFISMKIADDDLAIAQKNLSRASILSLQKTLPRDGSEMNGFQDFHNSVANSHSITNPLLNPFNWGSLIKEISEGDKARSPSTN